MLILYRWWVVFSDWQSAADAVRFDSFIYISNKQQDERCIGYTLGAEPARAVAEPLMEAVV